MTTTVAASPNMALIMAACVVRGVGFAVLCVAGGALTVSLIPPQRRGEGLALVGIVGGVPSVAALPLGVWLAGHVGYRPVLAAARRGPGRRLRGAGARTTDRSG